MKTAILLEGVEVQIGDVVGFMLDIEHEESGKIVEIRRCPRGGKEFVLETENGLITTEEAFGCWSI